VTARPGSDGIDGLRKINEDEAFVPHKEVAGRQVSVGHAVGDRNGHVVEQLPVKVPELCD
jgi:hypothetical protein